MKTSRLFSKGRGVAEAAPRPADVVETDFQKLKTRIHREILDAMDLSRLSKLDEDRLRVHIRNLAEGILRGRSENISAVDEERLIDELMAESFGLGPLEPYMHDPDVTDILVNGPNEVFVERFGRLQATNTVFADDEHLMQIISRVAARVGRRIDEMSPMVDARLPDGSRVNAIIPPLALGGPVLSIRRFGHKPLQLEDLMRFGSICPEMVQLLSSAIEGRVNIMISGGTGAGKTMLLNCLSRFIPDGERLVTIEDSAELQLQRRHVVSLETRPANGEGTGTVTQRDLVRNSLRMRPDRIIVGEVRGEEALDMLQAMNTGHDGSLTTVHANSPRDALSRIETMVSMTGITFPMRALRAQMASAINVVIQVARDEDGRRRVTSVQEINGMEGEVTTMSEIYTFERSGVDKEGNVLGELKPTGVVPAFQRRLAGRGIDLPAALFSAAPTARRPA
jgi:pilus assembly protein CpaF